MGYGQPPHEDDASDERSSERHSRGTRLSRRHSRGGAAAKERREDAEEEEAQGLKDVVDENICTTRAEDADPKRARRGKWWGFSCRGELQGDDRADAIDDVGEAQSGKFSAGVRGRGGAARRQGPVPASAAVDAHGGILD